MKVFDVHKFDMKKEQDFLQVQFNLKNRINYPHDPSRLHQHLRRRRPGLLGAGWRTIRSVLYYRN